MNNLQQYIDLLKSEKLMAFQGMAEYKDVNYGRWAGYKIRYEAIDFCLTKAELLLNQGCAPADKHEDANGMYGDA